MKINELETYLGISRQTIFHYQQASFIQPKKINNEYKYNNNDLQVLSLIKFLRDYNISLEDIKLIFNQEINLNEYLKIVLDD